MAVLSIVGLAACGGGSASDATPAAPAATRTPRPEPARASATPERTSTPHPATPPACADPYPGGAPYEPPPGEPVRLRPIGSPPPMPSYRPIGFSTDRALELVVKGTIGEEEAEHFSVYIKNIEDGKGVSIDVGRQFYAASLYKVWVMLEAYHQRNAGLLDFSEGYIGSSYYVSLGLNPGEVDACEQISLDRAIERMMAISDNVAANMVLDRVGARNINTALSGFGMRSTGFLGGQMPTTAADMALLMEAIARGGALNETTSLEMLARLESEVIDDRIPALLPAGTFVAHKTGSWEDATHDAGIVVSPDATYVLVILTDYGYADGGAERIAGLSKAVYDYYN
ncbi:MAG: serine hydrolase [Dehalococcoidia bacterium]